MLRTAAAPAPQGRRARLTTLQPTVRPMRIRYFAWLKHRVGCAEEDAGAAGRGRDRRGAQGLAGRAPPRLRRGAGQPRRGALRGQPGVRARGRAAAPGRRGGVLPAGDRGLSMVPRPGRALRHRRRARRPSPAAAPISAASRVSSAWCATSMAGGRVTAMTLEHYPGHDRARSSLRRGRGARAAGRCRTAWWSIVSAGCCRASRSCWSRPRRRTARAALDACAFLIDWLKTKAPFWKLEETPAGERWVEARAGDDAAAAALEAATARLSHLSVRLPWPRTSS